MTRVIDIGDIAIGGNHPLAVIAGPCVIESEAHALDCAGRLKAIFEDVGIPFIYKSSYDKANRTSLESFRGLGMEEGLRILKKVREDIGVPVLSDVHTEEEVGPAAEVLDVIQIPAYLSMQSTLVAAAARTLGLDA